MRKSNGGQTLVAQLKYFSFLLGFLLFLCLFFQLMTGHAVSPQGGVMGRPRAC